MKTCTTGWGGPSRRDRCAWAATAYTEEEERERIACACVCVCVCVCVLSFRWWWWREGVLAGPALNSLDRVTDPWGLAVPAEREKTAEGLPRHSLNSRSCLCGVWSPRYPQKNCSGSMLIFPNTCGVCWVTGWRASPGSSWSVQMPSAATWPAPYFPPLSSAFRPQLGSRGRGAPFCNTSAPWRAYIRGTH